VVGTININSNINRSIVLIVLYKCTSVNLRRNLHDKNLVVSPILPILPLSKRQLVKFIVEYYVLLVYN